MKYRWPLGAVRPVRIPKRALCSSRRGRAGQPRTLRGSELSKVPCLAQNHFGYLEIAAGADLTLCAAGRGADEEAVCYSGEGWTGEALEPLVLGGEAESDSSRSCVRGTCRTGARPEDVIPGSVTKPASATGLSV